jgi:hypothetical protein
MMIKYSDLVQYIKDNHVNWNTDLFDVLRGFFDKYSQPNIPSPPIQQEILFPSEEFKEPIDGEYSIDDVLKLFST